LKSSAFEKSHVESVWTGLSESGPFQTGSLSGTCNTHVSRLLKNLDSIAFARSFIQLSQMEFRESLGFLNSRVFSESARADSKTADRSNRFPTSTGVWFSVHVPSHGVFADSEVIRGSGPEHRSL
jgi:hypothetical protein